MEAHRCRPYSPIPLALGQFYLAFILAKRRACSEETAQCRNLSRASVCNHSTNQYLRCANMFKAAGSTANPYPTPSSAVSQQARRQHEVDFASCCCVDLLVLVVHPTLCVHETQHNGRTRVIVISAPSTTFTNQDRPLPLSTSAARLSLAVPRWGGNRKECHRERRFWHAPGSPLWQRVCRHNSYTQKATQSYMHARIVVPIDSAPPGDLSPYVMANTLLALVRLCAPVHLPVCGVLRTASRCLSVDVECRHTSSHSCDERFEMIECDGMIVIKFSRRARSVGGFVTGGAAANAPRTDI